MKKFYTILILFLFVFDSSFSQSPGDIVLNVDTIWPGGTPGTLNLLNPNVVPLASSRACSPPVDHFAAAVQYQNGKVFVVAHEGILANQSIIEKDNLTFIENAIDWISPGPNSTVSLKQGWVNTGNSSVLQSSLTNNGHTFTTIATISAASLANTDILILGNDWNGNADYTSMELSAIDNFVANGGGLLIAGLGWSYPGGVSQYPMNSVSQLFGIAFTTNFINDNLSLFNGFPLLHNIWPDNLDSAYVYCPSEFFGINPSRGDTLRVLRLAVSTNGEFTTQNGGIANSSALIDAWLEDINELYGREYSLQFELIPNNDQLIFPDPNTDPWATLPPGSGGCTNASLILNDQATVIDNIIGSQNYDISHVIVGSPFGGGCAGGLKSAVSGGLNIPVTRHEMGHQFGQAHTINNSGDNNYELETGAWTVQGGNGHGFPHAVSFHQLAINLAGPNSNVGTKIPTGNSIPSIQAGPDVAIPHSTPFKLSSSGFDNDPGDSLTFVWDNISPGPMQQFPISNDIKGALFWRLLPSPESDRTFPKMQDVIANNNSNNQEQLPTQARVMDFRVMVNDHHKILYQGDSIEAGGVSSDDIRVTVANAGPFEVTSQNVINISYLGSTIQQVTWNVNGTDSMPVNTQFVEISLSDDGGYTYPYILDSATANNGSAMVTLPNINTNTARIKVAAVDNIYFDINTNDFEITLNTSALAKGLNSELTIYPNPARDKVYISIKDNKINKVELYDLQGHHLKTKFNEDHIDLNDFSEGVYLIKIGTDKGIFHHKLIVE